MSSFKRPRRKAAIASEVKTAALLESKTKHSGFKRKRADFIDPEAHKKVLFDEVTASGLTREKREILKAREAYKRPGFPSNTTKEMMAHARSIPKKERTKEDGMMLAQPGRSLLKSNISRNHSLANSAFTSVAASTMAQAVDEPPAKRKKLRQEFTALSSTVSGSNTRAQKASDIMFTALDDLQTLPDHPKGPTHPRPGAIRGLRIALEQTATLVPDSKNNMSFGNAQTNQEASSAFDPHRLASGQRSPRSQRTFSALKASPLLSTRMSTAVTTPAVRKSNGKAVFSKL